MTHTHATYNEAVHAALLLGCAAYHVGLLLFG